ncbi:hypothetical protein BJX76DRAFT_364364 [Aspergillus varians]
MASYNPNPAVHGNPFLNIPPDTDSNPFRWLSEDIGSVFRLSSLLPRIFLPLSPFRSGALDELYPSLSNLRDITLHIILILIQVFLIISLPFAFITLWPVPFVVHIVFYGVFVFVTAVVVRLLNGRPTGRSLIGVPTSRHPVNDERELWFFINGIATGYDITTTTTTTLPAEQNLGLTPTHPPAHTGTNQTSTPSQKYSAGSRGFLLDLLECLIQRDLDYKTEDIRKGRAQLRAALAAPSTKKVVLIAHSQGGIIASSILDWLFSELGPVELSKLEVYTFASAGRALRNPPLRGLDTASHSYSRSASNSGGDEGAVARARASNGNGIPGRVLRYVEHYANTKDFVSNIGVLKFTTPVAAYSYGSLFSGSVFVREGSGHLLNMHYLDTMFGENGGFMNRMVEMPVVEEGGVERIVQRPLGDLSRLWKYRDGESPEDEAGEEDVKGVDY